MNAVSAIVTVEGRSWESMQRGIYCFEVSVNGVLGELQVQEDLAFDLLGAWTLSARTCLDILRLHRGELAEALTRKLGHAGVFQAGPYLLTWQDLEPGCLSSRLSHAPTQWISRAKRSRRHGTS
jgi:hypothetical protein